ncbi:YhcN/YlaJ family sporulation lipoprotein [Paenibacillus alkalitolerans]|uniref:YhcN/YlaJ family sporulation lipoprotein n=1 Tax=Paenibacillus alkalitolerans TaxID=2799335 RepID=UPI001F2C3BDF|nr:YhcN/YlaJ family sporulation lipoprotein [Paenibacillus alkalitolerans]
MMMTRKGTAAAAVVLALTLSACSPGDPDAASQANRADENRQIRAQQTAPAPERNADANDVALRLEQLAKSVPEVQNANCVVLGQTAIVGIDVGGRMDRSRVGTIKYAVAEALRKDPYGVNAVVTADMDINHRLQEIGEDIRAGRPLDGFAEELADIVGRIIPQLPRDTVEREDVPSSPRATTEERGANKADRSTRDTLENSDTQGPGQANRQTPADQPPASATDGAAGMGNE